MKLTIIRSLSELQPETHRWNQLWQASLAHLPTCQAQPLIQFVNKFHPHDQFAALIVEDDGRWVGALPLIIRRKFSLAIAELPNNEWIQCGDLLVATDVDQDAVTGVLAQGLKDIECQLFNFDWTHLQRASWQLFLGKLKKHKHASLVSEGFSVGRINCQPSWQKFQQGLSKSFRKSINKNLRRLESMGEVRMDKHNSTGSLELAASMQTAFDIEHRSWKGQAKTSIRAHELETFFSTVADQLAVDHHCELRILKVDEQPIAFELGFFAKGVYVSHKIGFDPEYARFGPGQLLTWMTLKQLHERGECEWVDTVGELSEATAKWCDCKFRRQRIRFAPPGIVGSFLIRTMDLLRKLKSTNRPSSEPVRLPEQVTQPASVSR